MKYLVIPIFLISLTLPTQAWSVGAVGSWRCKPTGKIVKLNDSLGSLIRFCGEPHVVVPVGVSSEGEFSATSSPSGTRGSWRSFGTENVIWEYYFSRLPVRFHIIRGMIRKIEVGER